MSRNISFVICVVLLTGCAEPPSDVGSFNRTGAPIVEFSVPDMMCADGCGPAVEATLAKQPGALDVRVDFDTKTATVAVDKDKFDADNAVAALVDKMFPNSKLKSAELAEPKSASEAVVH